MNDIEVILLSLVVPEICDITYLCNYGYGLKDGPHIWKQGFSRYSPRKQLPVNIISDVRIVYHKT